MDKKAPRPRPKTLPESPEQQKQQQLQQEPSESLQITINEDGEKLQEEATSPDSERVISIDEKKLEQARQDDVAISRAKPSIYRIPDNLRGRPGDSEAYVPQTVFLGPYYSHRNYGPMYRHKWRSLNRVLERTKHDVKRYLDSMKEIEDRARSCYEGPIRLSSNEFVGMLVLDGFFVLELLRGATEGFTKLGYSSNDPVFAMRGSMHFIQRDMIKLENQLPLFVLDRLWKIQLGNPVEPVENLVLRFFDSLMPTDKPLEKSDIFDPLADGLHCLDVFRRGLLRSGPQRQPRIWIKWRRQLIHCVTELKESGIKFKERENTNLFWDIKFKDGILQMPRLFIHDGTESMFRNLIALEQCDMYESTDITSYAVFMDSLINSPDDVGYLHYHGIIEHWLGSDAEVADLFNRLCKDVTFDINDSYLCLLSEDVNLYCTHSWNAWRASLRHDYFSNPWAIISLVAAVLLLLLTFAQTFYTMYGYYRPAR